MQSPDPNSKKENGRSSKQQAKNEKKEKPKDTQPLSLLKDLPSLGGSKKAPPASSGFDDFDFDDDQQQKSVMGSGSVNKFSKAE